jgi:hypothetical protein
MFNPIDDDGNDFGAVARWQAAAMMNALHATRRSHRTRPFGRSSEGNIETGVDGRGAHRSAQRNHEIF